MNTLLQLKQDTVWEALRLFGMCRNMVNTLRTDTGFMKVWEKENNFARMHNIGTQNLKPRKDNHLIKKILRFYTITTLGTLLVIVMIIYF